MTYDSTMPTDRNTNHDAKHACRGLATTFALALLFAFVTPVLADPPAGYWDGADLTSAEALKESLHEIIDDHQRIPYTSSSTADAWDVLELADEDPDDSGRILTVYRNRSLAKWSGGASTYNREHTWPRSYGFPDDHDGNYPFSDCHHLFLADPDYNTARSNKPFIECDADCEEWVTDGGSAGVFPGTSNWTRGEFTEGAWQIWSDRRGDVARGLLYLAVRYEGGTHGVTGFGEPDLELTDDISLIQRVDLNRAGAWMGSLSTMLDWHEADPPDAREMNRNDVVASFQGNRNPFIDHPEWADCVFNEACGTTLDTVLYFEVAANLEGAFGSRWTSDLAVGNLGEEEATVELVLHLPSGQLQLSQTVAPGAEAIWEDLVGTAFASTGKGVLELRSNGQIRAVSRLYNTSETGTFGQQFRALKKDEALSAGDSAVLLGLRQQTGVFRTNLQIASVGGDTAVVDVILTDVQGNELHNVRRQIEHGVLLQMQKPFESLAGEPDLGWGRIEIEIVSGSAVLVSASVVDSRTNDPVTVTPER